MPLHDHVIMACNAASCDTIEVDCPVDFGVVRNTSSCLVMVVGIDIVL